MNSRGLNYCSVAIKKKKKNNSVLNNNTQHTVPPRETYNTLHTEIQLIEI